VCEQYVAISAAPFRIDALWPFTERLETYGLAGFGWGATWLDASGELESHRDIAAFREDPRRAAVGEIETRALLLHLRRPSKFSTIGLPDTQPFDDPLGRYAFSHNGRLLGKADTEVGARWLEDHWAEAGSVPGALNQLHDTFGGHANLAVLTRTGEGHHYAGNDENPVFTFNLGEIRLACTGMYSLDRSVFKFVAPEATNRRLVRQATTASI